MKSSAHQNLTRRERQIMDVVYRHGRVTAAEVMSELPDAPSYSTVRAMLSKLEAKGHLRHRADGPRYVYQPTVPRQTARETALSRLVSTFFEDSPSKTVAALLEMRGEELSETDLDELSELIARTRKRGR